MLAAVNDVSVETRSKAAMCFISTETFVLITRPTD